MKCFENSMRVQLYAVIIAVSSLVVAFPASEGHHIGQIKERIGGWQRQIAEMWVTDTCKAMDFATNIVTSIKAVGDVGMRRKLATDYACFILELDVTHRCNTTDPMFRRRFLLYDAIELLDLSAEGAFAKWRIRLDYCRHLKMEAEWLLNAAGTNLPMSGFAMTGEVVVVSGADIAKKYGQPRLLNDGKRTGYQNPNDSLEFTRRRKSQSQRAYSKILKEEMEDQALAFNGDTFKRDYESLSVGQKLELQRTMEEVFGRRARVNDVQNRDKRVEAEQVLGRSLREIPFSRRYDAVLKKVRDLWGVLDGMMSSDAYYVILASARFQKEIEDELNSAIPVRPRGKEMSSVAQGGVQYRLMAKDEAEDFMRRSREIAEMEEYRRQLRHFLSCYPQRLDSNYIRTAIERMPPDRRNRIVIDIERILGRNIMSTAPVIDRRDERAKRQIVVERQGASR